MTTQRITRLGKTTDRVIQGKEYTYIDGHIIDDNGDKMKPCLDFNNIWEIASDRQIPTQPTEPTQTPIKKERQMIQIEEQILINGKPSDEYSIHELLALLADAEEYLGKQEKLSKANENKLSGVISKLATRTNHLSKIIQERENEF